MCGNQFSVVAINCDEGCGRQEVPKLDNLPYLQHTKLEKIYFSNASNMVQGVSVTMTLVYLLIRW